ncbi:MAG TPA: glycosyltransferase family 2 protein [Clostridia bacterium]
MKLITFGVPCYNSEAYMRKCVDSLLAGGDEIEIIIVNDGSIDNTASIVNEYQSKYPQIVKAVHKENGGHGSGVNKSLELASGLYYKVVDSDDWLDASALKRLMDAIKACLEKGDLPDLFICDYVYEHASDNTQKRINYSRLMPKDRIFTWEEVKKFPIARILMMHSLVYKTQTLRESGLALPERTFYVDNIYAYKPLPYARKLYYLETDLYHYFIGRSDQSVNIKNFVNRYEQQIRVMKEIVDAYSYDDLTKLPKPLRKYMLHYIGTISMNTLLFTGAADSPERRKAYKDFWRYFKQRDFKLYRKIRYFSYPAVTNPLPWKIRGWAMVRGYNILCRVMKLG